MQTHRLKTWPEYYEAMQQNRKPFELRFNDRDFQEGDKLILEEFVPCELCKGTGRVMSAIDRVACPSCFGEKGKFTGRGITRYVTYILKDIFGLKENWIVMGISRNRV